MLFKNFNKALKKHRRDTGESRARVGLRAGIVEHRLYLISKGKKYPKIQEKEALAQALGCDSGWLFQEFDKESGHGG